MVILALSHGRMLVSAKCGSFARASGILAFLLLTASVLAGLLLRTRMLGKLARPATVTDIHRFLALLGFGAIAVHGVALVLDATVPIPVLGLLVPGLSPYRTLSTGVGVVAGELALLIYLSFPLRRLIGGAKAWRKLHYATYLVFAGATVHGIATGTDTGRPWMLGMYGGAVALVVAATAFRVAVPTRTPARQPIRREQGSQLSVGES